MKTRLRYTFPLSIRPQLEATIEQCAAENGGQLVGEPSIEAEGKMLEVDDHPWWREHMRVVYPQLILLAANQFTNKESVSADPPDA
jgi:hypothetical protein